MLLIVKASDSTIWLSIQDPTTLAPAGLFRDPDPLRFNLHLELLSQVSNCGLHRCDLALHISTVEHIQKASKLVCAVIAILPAEDARGS